MLMGIHVNSGMGHETQLLNVAKRITRACKSLTNNDFQIQKEYVDKSFLVFITIMYLGVYLAVELISKSFWTYIVFIFLSFNRSNVKMSYKLGK